MILQWSQTVPGFTLNWLGPNTIQTSAITSMADVERKIAVISGPRGPQGIQGPPGSGGSGGSDVTFTWSPPSATVSWVIPHNLGKFASITTVDNAGRIIYGEVTYLDINLVEIAFAFPVSGTAYLN